MNRPRWRCASPVPPNLRTALAVIMLCISSAGAVAAAGAAPAGADHFVGSETCTACHRDQARAWRDSHHDLAMALPTPETVRGDFDDTVFDGTRFHRRENDYFIETPGPDGEPVEYRVRYTFGWEPLQQYLVDIGNGKLQVFEIAWNVLDQAWFRPLGTAPHGDWLHWRGGAMNWNTMCADCHSTRVEIGFDPEADSFDTRYAVIDVGCEACHGPGRAHVQFMASPAAAAADRERIRADLRLTPGSQRDEVLAQCATCHSRREKLDHVNPHDGDFFAHYRPELVQSPAWFADGQIHDEVYVYGSFLQSRMHGEDVGCSDCHDPHSLQLVAPLENDALCLQCHDSDFGKPKHHFHEAAAVQCVDCHMPGRTYMGNDFRRDHGFRPPRPDLTITAGVPNACNDCHDDRSAEWAAGITRAWYGAPDPTHPAAVLANGDNEALIALTGDDSRPPMARAAAITRLAADDINLEMPLLRRLATDENPLVRTATARALAASGEELSLLLELAADPARAVRLGAIERLLSLPDRQVPADRREAFDAAMAEYRTYLDVNRYFPAGLMNRGIFFQHQGQPRLAEQAWRETLSRDPRFNPARVNLSMLLNSQGRNVEARRLLREAVAQAPDDGGLHYSLALLLAETGELPEALPHLQRAATLAATNPRIHYNLAVALQQTGRPQAAERAYLDAIALAPQEPDFRYGIASLYLQQGQPDEARPHVLKLQELLPGHPTIEHMLQLIDQ